MSLIVALTGGIASGKSRAAAEFGSRGATIFDADVIARDLVRPGQPALAEIVAQFGAVAVLPSGELDRTRLRLIVFSDPSQRRRLERILHPRIGAALRSLAAGCVNAYCVLAIPLLAENRNDYEWVDRVVVVDASIQTQIARLMQRDGTTRDAALLAVSTQATRAERLALADDVIDNDEDSIVLERAVDRLDKRYRELAAAAARE